MRQIKKLKDDENLQGETFRKIHNDKNLLENKLEQIHNEGSKSSGIKVQVAEKDTITSQIQITAQGDVNPIEKKTYMKVKPRIHYKHDKGK